MKLKEKNNLLSELVQIVEILRAPNGCDWDKEQTSQSLIPYFIEEAYEVIEAIEKLANYAYPDNTHSGKFKNLILDYVVMKFSQSEDLLFSANSSAYLIAEGIKIIQ